MVFSRMVRVLRSSINNCWQLVRIVANFAPNESSGVIVQSFHRSGPECVGRVTATETLSDQHPPLSLSSVPPPPSTPLQPTPLHPTHTPTPTLSMLRNVIRRGFTTKSWWDERTALAAVLSPLSEGAVPPPTLRGLPYHVIQSSFGRSQTKGAKGLMLKAGVPPPSHPPGTPHRVDVAVTAYVKSVSKSAVVRKRAVRRLRAAARSVLGPYAARNRVYHLNATRDTVSTPMAALEAGLRSALGASGASLPPSEITGGAQASLAAPSLPRPPRVSRTRNARANAASRKAVNTRRKMAKYAPQATTARGGRPGGRPSRRRG